MLTLKENDKRIRAKQEIFNLGYTCNDVHIIKGKVYYIIEDSMGYKYRNTFSNIKKGTPAKFNIYNPYSMDNVKNWLHINNKKFEILGCEYLGMRHKYKFHCLDNKCDGVWDATLGNIIHRGSECPFCNGDMVNKNNCLLTTQPELAKQWNYKRNGQVTPYNITAGSEKKVWWICENGHEWKAQIKSRKTRNCPYCSHKKASAEYNLFKDNPKLCKEWDYDRNNKNPKQYTPNTKSYVWWKCKNGHSWRASIIDRNKGGNGCPYCSGFLPTAENNLFVKNPLLSMQWDYEKNKKLPMDYTPFSNKKVWWVCPKCGRKWEAQINDRNRRFANSKLCSHCSMSYGENKISEFLCHNNIRYIYEKTFDDLFGLKGGLLSYDFYLIDYNLLIEYQGEFHDGSGGLYTKLNLKSQKDHDDRKRNYAKKHNIDFLEIWYWDYDNIDKILFNKLL